MRETPFYIVGNWKSNKTLDEAETWFAEFVKIYKKQPFDSKTVRVILCPPSIHLVTLDSWIKNSGIPLELGLQDVSPFSHGTYTGAISSDLVKGLVSFSLVGHSERRQHFNEKEPELLEKINRLKEVSIEPIYCIQNSSMSIPESCLFVGYEPDGSISSGDPYTGHPDNPEDVNRAAFLIKQAAKHKVAVIYGGSTTPENVTRYLQQPNIDGVVPGGASLKAKTFFDLIINATRSYS